MLDRFLKNLTDIDLYNSTIVIGVSTGVDSMVLLDMFMKIKQKYNLKLIVSHINHKKRVQSDLEEAYIIDYCTKNGIIVMVDHFLKSDVDNFQSEARDFRYSAYLNACAVHQSNIIALAHHGYDQIETILMRILRGSSLRGYGGMDLISQFKGHTIIRPLLSFGKDEIYNYAKENKIHYFEDESNQSDDYTRNRIRNNIIPAVLKQSPNACLKFMEFSNVLKKACNYLDSMRDEFISKFVRRESDAIILNIDEFKKLDSYIQEEVLFEVMKKNSLSKSQIEEIIKIIYSQKPNIISNIKNTFSVIKEYDELIILDSLYQEKVIDIVIDKCGNYENDKFSLSVVKKEGNPLTNNTKMCYNDMTIYIDEDFFPLRLRSRRIGDRILLSSGIKKVKDVLIDEKIGLTKRDSALVLVDKDDDILWICGIKKSEKIKQSRRAEIKISLEGNNK